MGHPNSPLLFGIPARSSDNRLYTRYPRGDAPNAGSPQGLGASVIVSASSGSAFGGGGGAVGGYYPSTATHFVHPSAGGSGIGTEGNPFTLAQALALAQPGWSIRCDVGDLYGTNTNSNTPALRFANSGTQLNPIVIWARYPAALHATNRTNLRLSSGTQGSGCPVLGANTGHHWYGMAINENTAPTHPDTGPVTCGGQYNKFAYFHVDRGDTVWPVADNNHSAFRFEGSGCRNNVVSDCYIANYSGIGWPGSEQAFQVYGPSSGSSDAVGGLIFENCVLDNVQYGLTVKSIQNRLIEGGIIMRGCLIRPSAYLVSGDLQSGGVNVIETGNTLGRTQFYRNIQVGGAVLVKISRHFGYGAKDIDVINNTCVGLTRNGEFNGFLSSSGDGGNVNSSGWRVHNNIKTGTALARIFRYDTGDSALASMSHNLSNGGANGWWAEHPDVAAHSSLRTLAEWVAAWALDRNSLTSDPQFQSSTWGNANLAKLQAGSPARGAGVDILNLLGGGTSASINMGAFITLDMSDLPGIRIPS